MQSARPPVSDGVREKRGSLRVALLGMAALTLAIVLFAVLIRRPMQSEADLPVVKIAATATAMPDAEATKPPESEIAAANAPAEDNVPESEPTILPSESPDAPEPAVEDPAVAADSSQSTGDYAVLDGIPNTDRALGLPECAPVPDSYFDDAVFIGDSVTLKLNYYVRDCRNGDYPNLLGNAQFLTAGSLGSGNAMKPVSDKSKHPTYQGKKQPLEDSVADMGAQKVYIMLGINDIALYGPEQSAANLIQLCRNIKEKSPKAKIFIQSATPRLKGNYQKLNNNALFQYDLYLYEYCKQYAEYGLYFVDVAYVMRDAEGNLPTEYCSDPNGQALHFRSNACKLWIQYLYTHALTT